MTAVRAFLLCALAVMATAAGQPLRIWILPFENPGNDTSLEYLEEGLPALLAVSITQSDRHAVVDRQHWNEILAEQSLTLQGLTAPNARHRVGRLLGATVILTGSFVSREPGVLITMRASDVETGMVTAAAEAVAPVEQLGQLVSRLYRRLARDLGKRLPDLPAETIDEAPLSNLHLMRGLGFYYSARYNEALAEFMQAVQAEDLTAIVRLWLANTYLAQQRYGHACLELNRLIQGGSSQSEVGAKLQSCEKHLDPAEVRMIRELAVR